MNRDGKKEVGTGFHLKFSDKEDSLIVTNKHVLKGAVRAHGHFTRSAGRNIPDIGNHFRFVIPKLGGMWIPHPDPSVDLAAILRSRLSGFVVPDQDPSAHFPFLDSSLIPNEARFEDMRLIEEVIMVGYPEGLWDEAHNLPIVRRGTTATHPAIDFDKRPGFLIDCAVFPGSSGSPVLYYRPELPFKSGGGLRITGAGPQLELLGVLSQLKATEQTNIPINIGFVIKADKLHDFAPFIT